MDRFEAAARGAYIQFASGPLGVNWLLIVKRIWATSYGEGA